MSGRIKHELRSHKTYGKGYGEFSNFARRAMKVSQSKVYKKVSFLDKLKNLFKRTTSK